VCSDMWKPYLKVIAAQAGQGFARAGPIPYHEPFESGGGSGAPRRKQHAWGPRTRKQRSGSSTCAGPCYAAAAGCAARARQKLNALLASKLATARAWDLKETYLLFLEVQIRDLGRRLSRLLVLSGPCGAALEPMKKVARMLRAHEPLILNWFRAKGEISNGAVEGPQQQNPSGYQTILRLSHLRTLWKLPYITTWDDSQSQNRPQILLRKRKDRDCQSTTSSAGPPVSAARTRIPRWLRCSYSRLHLGAFSRVSIPVRVWCWVHPLDHPGPAGPVFLSFLFF